MIENADMIRAVMNGLSDVIIECGAETIEPALVHVARFMKEMDAVRQAGRPQEAAAALTLLGRMCSMAEAESKKGGAA